MESDGVRHRILLSLSTTPLGECRAPYSPLSADIESFRQLLCLPGGWTVRVSRRAPAAYRAASVRTNPQDLHLAPARQPATPGRRMPNALPSSRHWRGVRTPRRVPRSAHALALGVIRLAGQPAAPRAGARDAGERGYEAVFTPASYCASLAYAEAVARATSRLRVGTGVTNIYLRQPTLLAAEAAAVQELSGGRLLLGVGVGHRAVNEPLGVDMSDPVGTMRSVIGTLRAAWTKGPTQTRPAVPPRILAEIGRASCRGSATVSG